MSNVWDLLASEKITFKRRNYGDHHMVCPKCNGGRTKEPSLSVTVDSESGVWICHRAKCGWTGSVRVKNDMDDMRVYRRREKPAPVKPSFTPKPDRLPQAVVDWFARRKISRATLDKLGISFETVWMPGPNDEVGCIAFPYTRDGEVINVKYRDSNKHFRQEKNAEKILYGMDFVPKDTDALIWVEGECDLAACHEAGIFNVVSVPDGAPAQFKWENGDRKCDVHKHIIDPNVMVCPNCKATRNMEFSDETDVKFEYVWNCNEFLSRFKKHILAFDDDAPGRILEDEISRRLGREICWRVRWPEAQSDIKIKDANEALIEIGASGLRECIDGAEAYPVRSLYSAYHYEDAVIKLYRDGRSRGLSTGFSNIDPIMTIRPGELSIVTGYPSSGKSEVVDSIAVNMAVMHGWKFAVCSFENPPDEHIAKWSAKYMGMPFYDGPSQRMSEDQLRVAMKWINDRVFLIRADDEAPTIEWVLDRAKVAVMRYGINGLILDPYNEFEHQMRDSQTETKYISDMLGKVKRFAQAHGVHVWFVAHPAKPPKEYQNKAPTLYDISGGANWNNKADIGFSVHRPFNDDGTRSDVSEVHVLKVRFRACGEPGVAKLQYQPGYGGRYSEVVDK